MGGSRFYISHDKTAGYSTLYSALGILHCNVVYCTVTVQCREMKQSTVYSLTVQCTAEYCSEAQCTIQCCAVQ